MQQHLVREKVVVHADTPFYTWAMSKVFANLPQLHGLENYPKASTGYFSGEVEQEITSTNITEHERLHHTEIN